MRDIITSARSDLVICPACGACKLLPAAGGGKGMEGGEGKHLSSVRHLLPEMTQSDCRESRMERSPFTITVAPVGSFPPALCFLAVSVRGPAWP